MTDFVQPGLPPFAPQAELHPDPDQLSAFAENALPAHEREATLLHLAACARCREIVALSLPPQEAQAAELPAATAAGAPEKRSRHWLGGWHLWLPTGSLAAAALVVLALHIHQSRQAVPPQPSETASITPPASPTLQSPAPLPAPARAAALDTPTDTAADKANGTMSRAAKMPPPAALMKPQPATGTASTQAMAGVMAMAPAQDSANYTLRAAPKVSSAPLPMAAPFGYSNDGAVIAKNQYTAGAASGSSANGQVIGGMAQAAPLRQQQANAAPAAPPLPAPPLPAPTRTTAEGRAVLQDEAAAAPAPALAPLPSHRPLATSAAQGARTLALDADGALFLSVDFGRHWTAVQVPWKGNAASLVTAGYTQAAGRGTASIAGLITDASGAAIPGASVTVTDTHSHVAAATVRTDRTGRYLAAGLGSGAYTITVYAPGFETRTSTASLIAAERLTLDAKLQVGSVSESVTVNSDAVRIDTQSAAGSPVPEAKKKYARREAAVSPSFEVITARGEHWTSADGVTWTRTEPSPK